MQNKKTLFLIFTPRYSGAEIALVNLIKHSRHDNYLILCHNKRLLPYELQNKAVESNYIRLLHMKRNMTVKMAFKVLKIILGLNLELLLFVVFKGFKVVYSNNIQIASYILPGTLIRHIMFQKTYIWHDHNLTFPHLYGASKLENLCHLLFTKTIVPSHCLLKKYKNKEKITIINNGVNTNLFQYDQSLRKAIRTELKISEERLVVGIIGEISERKGQLGLIKAFKANLERYANQHLLIIGNMNSDDKIFINEFKKRILEIDKEYISVIPWQNDISKYYSAIDILVNASLPQYGGESFGLTIIEAMSSGRIVLAADNGNTSEIINEGINGFTYEPNNIDQLQEKMFEIMHNFIKLSHINKNARDQVLKRFNILKLAEEFERLFTNK